MLLDYYDARRQLLASLPVPDPREQRKHREHLHELLAAQQ